MARLEERAYSGGGYTNPGENVGIVGQHDHCVAAKKCMKGYIAPSKGVQIGTQRACYCCFACMHVSRAWSAV